MAVGSAQAQTPTAAAPVTPGAAAQTAGGTVARRGIKLGFDHFAIRGFSWKAPQLIDYAASQKLDAIFLSELNVLESRDDAYLKVLRARPKRAGSRCISACKRLPDLGHLRCQGRTASEQLKDAIRMAKTVGSPVIRCSLGTGGSRQGRRHRDAHQERRRGVQGRARRRGRPRRQNRGREPGRRHAGLEAGRGWSKPQARTTSA